MTFTWNPWHGCRKLSAGCMNCYVYRIDSKFDRNSSVVSKTSSFTLPVRRGRSGAYKVGPGSVVYTCFTSDFFIEDADEWRAEAWRMMRERSDVEFFMITKRIHRFAVCVPDDWGEGYPNVSICCTVENQEMADYRLAFYVRAPIAHKRIICEPLLGEIDIAEYLYPGIEELAVGGESGEDARLCDYDWVLSLRAQCIAARVPFMFRQTGANFRKDGRTYRIPRRLQSSQARRAGIDYSGD
ncbi:MAG TPA: DUF5131 family protein [Spirochaetota bacterium]|nr:DUF5131 family protein [Spirochaetota bacterium]